MFEEITLCKQARNKARLNTSNGDRISDLPNDILAQILSFVSTKEAVKTCVLSKRWRRVWAFVPVLRLDIKEFVPEGRALDEVEKNILETKFSKFIRGVLQNREKLQLDVFTLDWSTMGRSEYCNSELVEECVLHAIRSKPRVFTLHVFDCYNLNLNYNQIFTCASLEEISLMTINEGEYGAYEDVVLRFCNLPKLKRLHIEYKKIDDYCLKTLFWGCPALEELELYECGLLASEIYSTWLKRLVIRGCFLTDARLDISVPSLVHLTIAESEWMMESISGNFASLVDASISFPPANDDDDEFAMLLKSLSNATSLDLSFEHLSTAISVYTKKLQEEGDLKFPSFKNLRSLVLGNMDSDNIDLIALFLQHSPNLRELTHKELNQR